MINILRKFNKKSPVHLSADALWRHLHRLYDMAALEERVLLHTHYMR